MVQRWLGGLELSPGAFNSSDDVGNGVMDFCSKQSASVMIDLASAALKSTASFYGQ